MMIITKFEPGEKVVDTNGNKLIVVGYNKLKKRGIQQVVVRDAKHIFYISENRLVKSYIPQILGWADKYVNIFNTKGKHFMSAYITNDEYHFTNFSNNGLKVLYINDDYGCIQKVIWKDDPSEYRYLKAVFHCI